MSDSHLAYVVRKKPVEVEAIQYDGTRDSALSIFEWIKTHTDVDPRHYIDLIPDDDDKPILLITTLEGSMQALQGHWIIKGVQGEYYPCDPEVFKKSYDILGPVED